MVISIIWGNRLYRDKGRVIDGLHGSQCFNSQNLVGTFGTGVRAPAGTLGHIKK